MRKVTLYNEDPLEVARAFEAAGIRRLHLVDLDGAKAGAVQTGRCSKRWRAERILSSTSEGASKKEEDLDACFQSGAALATIGSMAVKHPDTMTDWMDRYGADKFLLGADVKGEKIAVGGWLETTELRHLRLQRL